MKQAGSCRFEALAVDLASRRDDQYPTKRREYLNGEGPVLSNNGNSFFHWQSIKRLAAGGPPLEYARMSAPSCKSVWAASKQSGRLQASMRGVRPLASRYCIPSMEKQGTRKQNGKWNENGSGHRRQ